MRAGRLTFTTGAVTHKTCENTWRGGNTRTRVDPERATWFCGVRKRRLAKKVFAAVMIPKSPEPRFKDELKDSGLNADGLDKSLVEGDKGQ